MRILNTLAIILLLFTLVPAQAKNVKAKKKVNTHKVNTHKVKKEVKTDNNKKENKTDKGEKEELVDSSIFYQRVDTIVKVNNSMPISFKGCTENEITKAEKLNPYFEILCARQKPARIVHLGDSHLRGHILPVVIRKQLENAWGKQAMNSQNITYKTSALAKESGLPGFVYHAWGKNGAISSYFNTPERINKVKTLAPDLIILSFGTNEAHVKKYNAEHHEAQLKQLIDSLSKACPNSLIMLTTPQGSYFSRKIAHNKTVKNKKGKKIKKRTYTYTHYINPNTKNSAETIRKVAAQYDLPIWDLYTIAGGEENACANWVEGKYMKADRIHFTPNGYTVQGKLLSEAILKAYNKYVKK